MNLHHAIKKILFGLLLCLSTLPSILGQSTASPFDIIPRIESQNLEDSTITIVTSSNPFDLIKINPANRQRTTSPSGGFQVIRKNKPLSAREKSAIFQRFLFIVILTMMVILTLVVTVFRLFIGKIWRAFLNDNLLSQLMREQTAGITIGYLILYLMFFINMGIFLFLLCKNFDIKITSTNLTSLMICIGGVAAFFTVRHLLLQIVRYVFPVDKEVSTYNFTIVVFNIVIGIILVPLILLIAYAPENITNFIIYTTLALIAIVLLFRTLRGLFIGSRFFAWHKFHFFLYLCTVEIAPVLVIAKLLNLH